MPTRDNDPAAAGDSPWDLPTTPSEPVPPPPPYPPAAGGRHAPGSLLAARYSIVRFLARGGMGEVYEAEDCELNVRLALKTIRPELAESKKTLERFKRELLLARSITHPNVCRVYDLGRHEDTSFLTMELLRGETLLARIRRHGRLAAEQALPLVRHMCAGLEAAHRAGVVHRDFKSSNVLIVPDLTGERAVVTDFGLAHAAAGDAAEHSASGVVGTPAYMAPEQVRGERAGPPADLYALGVVMFVMVTGRLPFLSESPLAAAALRLARDPPSPRAIAPGLSERWEAVILHLLARDPAERPARASDVVAELEPGPGVPGRGGHSLPAESDAFVGRQGELEELSARLSGSSRLHTLLGPGGSGKTRLSVHFGWGALERFPGGVWFCDLSEARSLEGLHAAVAGGLGVPLGRDDPGVQIGHAIAGRGRTLIVLDNFEQVARFAAQTLGRWVERAEEASFLVTSQERLGLKGEVVFSLEPLSVEGEGLALFALRAAAQRPDFVVGEHNREAVGEVVRMLDALPLAIELAAARVRLLTVEQIRDRLKDRFKLLTGGTGGPGRQATLRAALDWSWELLGAWERAALAQMTVFEGGFTLDAAEVVVELGGPGEAPAVLDAVQALLDKSLLRRLAGAADEPRFGMLVSVQEYAAERLRGSAGEAAARDRHCGYFARAGGEESLEALDGPGGTARRWALRREVENVVRACERAIDRGDPPLVLQTCAAVWAVLELAGPFGKAVELLERGLSIPGLDVKARISLLLWLGQAEFREGRGDSPRRRLEEAMRLALDTGDRRAQAHLAKSLANLDDEAGRMEAAREGYERSLALHREVGNRRGEGSVLGNLAVLHQQSGRMLEAIEHGERALSIHGELGDRRSEGIVLGNLGILDEEQGRMESARQRYERALAIHREVGNRRSEGIVLGNLGNLHREESRLDEARLHGERALAIHREVGNRRFEGVALGNLGTIDQEQGRMDQAEDRYRRALAIHRELGNRRFAGIVLSGLATLRSGRGDEAAARADFEEAEGLMRELGDRLELGRILCARGESELRAGDVGRARSRLAEAVALGLETGAGPASELGRSLARLEAALAAAGPG